MQLVDFGLIHGFKRRAASVFWLTSSVLDMATQAEAIRSSDQIACKTP